VCDFFIVAGFMVPLRWRATIKALFHWYVLPWTIGILSHVHLSVHFFSSVCIHLVVDSNRTVFTSPCYIHLASTFLFCWVFLFVFFFFREYCFLFLITCYLIKQL
jgi:hypothetical protein